MVKKTALLLACGISTAALATDLPFSVSDSNASSRLNTYWNVYGVSEGATNANGYSGILGLNSAWMEWDMLKVSWTAHNSLRDEAKNWVMNSIKVDGINGVTGTQAAGYVWSWGQSEYWPDGSGSGHGGVPSYHFDQIPEYIRSIHDYFIWTRDSAFLTTMLPRAETVMDSYLLGTMQGSTNVLIMPGSANNGTSTGRPSTYMDQLRSGYKDASVNATFYNALDNLADLEFMAGNYAKSTTYRNLFNQFSAQYDTAFWNGATLRFADWRDVNGTLHDAGYAWLNLMALARGLGTTNHAFYVFDWLNSPAQAAIAGKHAGSTDMHDYVATVRANSASVPLADWDSWSGSQTLKPYGSLVQNGGTTLWFAYYDIMARLRYSTADDAWASNWSLLDRMARDSEYLSYSSGRSYNDFGEDFVEFGTSQPFPESGISAIPILTGFMGVNAKTNGLNIQPNLPNALISAQAAEVNYRGTNRTINVSRAAIIAQEASANTPEQLNPGDLLEQSFIPSATFNEVGVSVGTYGTTSSAFTLDLQKYQSGQWMVVGSRRFTNLMDNAWVHLALATQAAGAQYLLRMYDVSGSIAWWLNSGSSFSGTAYRNSTPLTGDYLIRIISAPLTTLLSITSATVCDPNNLTQQTFSTAAPFDRIAVCVGTWFTTNSGCTMQLLRDVGGRWESVSEQLFRNVPDNSYMTMSMSDQPAGNYLLELRDKVGTIGWWRDANNAYSGGYALNDGVQVPGDRKFIVYRGKYTITIQPDNISTSIDAGTTYLFPPPPKIDSVSIRNGFALSFLALTNQLYSVEWITNPLNTNWSNLTNGIAGRGTTVTVVDPATNAAARFYRLHVYP